MDIRWLQSYIGVKGSVFTSKASRNLGQAFRKVDSAFTTFEESAPSLIQEEGEGGGEETVSASFLKNQWQNVPGVVTGGIIRLCHSTWYQKGSCLLPSTTEPLTFLEKRLSGISGGCGWGELVTSPLLQAPSGELHLLMQRKALGLLLLQPSVLREVIIKPSSPHCDPSCSANSSFVTTPRFPSGQRTPLKRAERTVQSVARGQLWGVWYPGASSAQVPWCSPVVVQPWIVQRHLCVAFLWLQGVPRAVWHRYQLYASMSR